MTGFDEETDVLGAYRVGRELVKKLTNTLDGKNSIASPYWKGSLAYA